MAVTKIPDPDFRGFETPLIRLVDRVLSASQANSAGNSTEMHSETAKKAEKIALTREILTSMVGSHQQIEERR